MTSDTLPKTYEPGDFSFIKDSHFQTAMKHAYDETTKNGYVEFFHSRVASGQFGIHVLGLSESNYFENRIG